MHVCVCIYKQTEYTHTHMHILCKQTLLLRMQLLSWQHTWIETLHILDPEINKSCYVHQWRLPSWSAWRTALSWPAAWARLALWRWCRLRSIRLSCVPADAGPARSDCEACFPDASETWPLVPAPQGAGCRCASQTCTHQREDYWSSSISTCLCERMYQTDLLRIAASSTQGMLVAPRTKTPSLLLPTPAEERCPQTLRQPTKKKSRGNNPARLCTPLHSL